MEAQNISVDNVEHSGITELVPCTYCGHHYNTDKYSECPCITENNKKNILTESAERLRYLMSLGHPGESGEPYNRYQVMDECRRRGKQVLIDLNWPTDPNAIYKNKYTGDEYTLSECMYKSCMDREKTQPFDERLNDSCWHVMEHWWPLELFDDSKLSKTNKLSDFKPKFSLTEISVYDDDEGFNDNANDLMAEEDYDPEVPRKPKKVVDTAQAGLGGWF